MHTLSNSLRALIAFILFLYSSNTFAYWQDSFYTDDSTYFLKINEQGFKQLVRIHKNDCHQVQQINVKTKTSLQQYFTSSKKIQLQNSSWPKAYGSNHKNYCWFEVGVNGVREDQIGAFPYSIEVVETSGNRFYYNGLSQSLLPKDRIKNNISEWIYLGGFGSTLLEGKNKTLFKIWEPHSEIVYLTVNGKRFPMQKETTAQYQNQFHYLTVDQTRAGSKYYYEFQKNGKIEKTEVANGDRWSSIKVDPYAKKLSYTRKGGAANGYISPHSVVVDEHQFQWNNDHRIPQINDVDYQNWLIYQIWPLTFAPKKSNGVYRQGTFDDIKAQSKYIEDLGINTVEFLPINESRFHATWGYALDSLFLVTQDYGSINDLKSLVDHFHSKDIKIIFDVVINHINNYLLREPLTKTVQTSKYYGGSTDWGPKPDFKNIMVQKWLLDALLYLKRQFHIDGYRFDMIKIVYQGSQEGYRFIQNFNEIFQLESPRFFSTAEELPDNVWSTYQRSQNGLAFGSQWNDKFKNAFEREFDFYRQKNRSVDLSSLASAIRGFSNHKNVSGEYMFDAPKKTINYLGSHDFIGNKDPIIRLVSDYESYEWEGNNHFFKVRPLSETQDRENLLRSLHNDFTHDLAKTSYGVLFSKPGHILFFQGEEVGNDINIENEWSYIDAQKNGTTPSKNVNVDKYVSSHRMLWEYVNIDNAKETQFFTKEEKNLFKGQLAFFKELIQLRKDHPEISNSHPQYVDLLHGNKVLSYHLKNGMSEFLVIANFGNDIKDKWVHFPGDAKTWWSEIINSAESRFGSLPNFYQNPISQQGGRHNQVRMKGPAISIFEKTSKAKISKDLFLRGTFNNWALQDKLLRGSDHGDIYVAEISIPNSGEHRFKLASQDWQYEIGAAPKGSQPKKINQGQGYLSSTPRRPDVRLNLDRGKYRFIFDIKTFKFSFIRL